MNEELDAGALSGDMRDMTLHRQAVKGGPIALLDDGLSFVGHGTNGRGVLLVHGITGSPTEMKPVAKILHRAGYSVYAPLLSGHGVDMETLRRTRWKDWYDGLRQSAEQFVSECDGVYVAGICGGGLLGLRLAHETPSIRAAAVYSPLLTYDGWNTPLHYRYGYLAVPVAVRLGFAKYIAVKERYPFGIKSDHIRDLLESSGGGIRGTLPAFPVETLYQALRLYRWIRKALPEIRTPSLIVHSSLDDLAGPSNATYIARHIGGPCEIEWLNNSYHMIHVDQERRRVADRTRTFFEQHAA